MSLPQSAPDHTEIQPETGSGAGSGTPAAPNAADLAGQLSARLCHDFISPASAIASGLDLLEDESAQDMREDAMNLIAGSARKLVALLAFSRVAFGTTAGTEAFDSRELETLARGVYAHVRPELLWEVAPASLPKPAARSLLNLAQIGAGALPTGGQARLAVDREGDRLTIRLEAAGARVRMKPEVQAGLRGEPLPEGQLAGHWVQAYLLYNLVAAAGGSLALDVNEERAAVDIRLPA